MLTLLANPALIPSGTRKMATDPAAIANIVANLHTILIDPDSTPEEAREAKRRLLAVLDATKLVRLPQMKVPALSAEVRASANETLARDSETDPDETCAVCSHPLPRTRSNLEELMAA